MKILDFDWGVVLRAMPQWTALPLAARRLVLEALHLQGYTPDVVFGVYLDAIVASTLVQHEPHRQRVLVPAGGREIVKLLRAAHRHPLFDVSRPPELGALGAYLSEHLTYVDMARLTEHAMHRGPVHVARAGLGERIGAADWPGDLLAATTDSALRGWVMRVVTPTPGAAVLDQFRDLQQLLGRLLERGGAMPLRELADTATAAEHHMLGRAIHAGASTLVLFIGMRPTDLEPMVGLWPAAARELLRSPVRVPEFVVPEEEYRCASLLEDMTAVLGAAVAAPLRIRANDGAIFTKARATITARLVAVPSWVGPELLPPDEYRVDVAAQALLMRRFIASDVVAGAAHFVPTPKGTWWLALSAQARLSALIDPIRASREPNPPAAYSARDNSVFFPYSFPYYKVPKGLAIREALQRSLVRATDGFLALDAVLDHASHEENPLTQHVAAPRGDLREMLHFGGADPRQGARALWRAALIQFLGVRLVALGGAVVGRLATGGLAFRLTDAGLYLLGVADTFSYGDDASAQLVVQPNFDVVFLAGSPTVEARVARFGERVGTTPGLAFSITRASVLSGAEQGLSADEMLATLRGSTSKPVPANVAREIAGWTAAVRRGRLRRAELIECATGEAGDRLAELVGNRLRRHAATLFELPELTTAARAALLKRIRLGGVFLTVETPAAVKLRRSGRGYRTDVDDGRD